MAMSVSEILARSRLNCSILPARAWYCWGTAFRSSFRPAWSVCERRSDLAELVELLPDEPDVLGVLLEPVGDVLDLLLEDLDVVVDQLVGLLGLIGRRQTRGA